jgi:uncharacterized membrane protein YfcA
VAGVVINAGRFWFYRASLDRRTLALVVGVSLPFLVLGTWIYAMLDVRVLGTVLGLVVVGSVPLRRVLRKNKITLNAKSLAIGSGVFGLATGVATGTGVIMVTLLLGTGMAGTAVLATDAMISIALDLCKAALFHRFALLDAQSFSTGLVIGAATIPGSAVAAWLVTRMHAHLHVLFMEALILVGGASLIVNSWR